MIALCTFSEEAELNGSYWQAKHSVTRIAKWIAAPISNVVLTGEVKAYFQLNFYIMHVHFKQ